MAEFVDCIDWFRAFLNRIIEIHEELFADLESNRIDIEEIRRRGIGLSLYTFRGNVSKLNKKIREMLDNESLTSTFEINITGSRGAKFYGIKATKEKLKIET